MFCANCFPFSSFDLHISSVQQQTNSNASDSLSDHSVDCELRAILTQGYTDTMIDSTTSSDFILPSTRSGLRNGGHNNSNNNNSRLRKGKSIGNLYLASTISSCGSSTSSEASYYSTCSSSSSNSADDELLETLVKTVTGGPMNRVRSRHSNSRLTDRKSCEFLLSFLFLSLSTSQVTCDLRTCSACSFAFFSLHQSFSHTHSLSLNLHLGR